MRVYGNKLMLCTVHSKQLILTWRHTFEDWAAGKFGKCNIQADCKIFKARRQEIWKMQQTGWRKTFQTQAAGNLENAINRLAANL